MSHRFATNAGRGLLLAALLAACGPGRSRTELEKEPTFWPPPRFGTPASDGAPSAAAAPARPSATAPVDPQGPQEPGRVSPYATVDPRGIGLVITPPKLGKAKITECARVPEPRLGWPVTDSDLIAAAALVQGGCAQNADLVEMMRWCSQTKGTGLVAVEADVVGRSACAIRPKPLAWEKRRWILFDVFVGVGPHFHGECHIVEMAGSKPALYHVGFTGNERVCGEMGPAQDPHPPDPPDPMIREWPDLPAMVREQMCSCGSK